MSIPGLVKQEPLIFPKEPFSVWCSLSKAREGNGRTQRIYIEQLCLNSGRFEIDFTDVSKKEMIDASIRSANVSNDMLEKLIQRCLIERN